MRDWSATKEKKMATNKNGFILWEGPSLIDGAPIVVVATGLRKPSDNTKTGGMIQTFIIRSDVHPSEALKSGADASVCGSCPKRPAIFVPRGPGDKRCYVDVAKSVAAVYRCYARGGYRTVSPSEAATLFTGRRLRMGTYGNPSAAPFEVWETANSLTAGHTAYIHNWDNADRRWSGLAMASVETVQQGLRARTMGYRLFHARLFSESTLDLTIPCPASKESGFRTTCFDCSLCSGHRSKSPKDITILVH
jgi:hypothetical protein